MSENFVAVYFKNGLGNFIMLTPAIQALGKLYDAKIDIILDDSWKDNRREGVIEFCEQWPLINEVVSFQKGFDYKKYKLLYYSRHGENSEAYSFFENHSTMKPKHINWRGAKLHEIDFYMDEVRDLGYKGSTPDQYIAPGGGAGFVKQHVIANPTALKIGICNGFFGGSTWQWERKGWPYFKELIENLFNYYHTRFEIYLFGKGEREKMWSKTFKEQKNLLNLVDRLSLGGTISVMKYMDLFITTDTGLMHIADGLRIPSIVLFGATLVSKNGPQNKEIRILRSPLPCAPCQGSPHFQLCKEWRCMNELKPEIVMAEVRSYLMEMTKEGKMMTKKTEGVIKPALL